MGWKAESLKLKLGSRFTVHGSLFRVPGSGFRVIFGSTLDSHFPMPPTTVASFLSKLPAERRKEVATVRAVIRKHLPRGYAETVRGTMIVYEVPLAKYPDTYNGQALWYAALAAPQSYLTLHLLPVYGSAELMKRLRADDLALEVIGEIVAAVPLTRWVEIARAARRR